jgi:NTP pyrophosphatase (non-canonical NTP hydrolase)
MNAKSDLMERLNAVSMGLSHRFPNHNEPFQIITRLLEECGELAEQVNHLGDRRQARQVRRAGQGQTRQEVQDVMRCALQIAQHYGVQPELEASIEQSYQRLKAEGFIE